VALGYEGKPYPEFGRHNAGRILILLVLAGLLGSFILPAAASGDSCTLSVLSIPDGAVTRIDGALAGTTPVRARGIPCGNHTVVVSAHEYEDFVETVNLERGNFRTIVANLRKMADRGSVLIASVPPGGDLYIDGFLRGTTPYLADALYPGPHTILIRKPDFEDYLDVVTTGSGMIPAYTEYLVPLPQTGFLGISSTPDGATAYLDGNLLGSTPTPLSRIAAGNHTLLIWKPGYRNTTQMLEITGGTMRLAQADLERIPEEGSLVVESSPGGAALYLNGIYKTVTPVTFEQVPPGNYTLAFQKPGYTGQNLSFTLNGGETHEIIAILNTDPHDDSRPFIRTYSATRDVTENANVDGTPGLVIDKKYQWYVQGQPQQITLHIPERLYAYYKKQSHATNITSLGGYTLSSEDRRYLHGLIGQLKDTSGNRNHAARNDYHNVAAFVQGIPYALHTDPVTRQTTTGANDFWKYPIETLVEGNGNCIDDAILAASLLKEMGYDVAIVLLPPVGSIKDGHAVVGIACENCNGYYYPVDGRRYYYLDLTAPGLSLGAMSYPGQDDVYAHTTAQVFIL
jgi:hypothetical protein